MSFLDTSTQFLAEQGMRTRSLVASTVIAKGSLPMATRSGNVLALGRKPTFTVAEMVSGISVWKIFPVRLCNLIITCFSDLRYVVGRDLVLERHAAAGVLLFGEASTHGIAGTSTAASVVLSHPSHMQAGRR